jgi:adenylate cyclase
MMSLGRSLNRPSIFLSALDGEWRYSLVTDRLSATLRLAKRIHTLAREESDPTIMIGAYRDLAITLYYLGNFTTARKHAISGVQVWRSAGLPLRMDPVKFPLGHPLVACLNYEALSSWHQQTGSYRAIMTEAIDLAEELNDMHAFAMAQWHAGCLAYFERDSAEVENRAADLTQLATRHNFAYWLAAGAILRGWARSASGDPGGISRLEEGIKAYLATGSRLGLPFFLALKAEALHQANRTSEALRMISEAKEVAERFEERWWSAELHRLSGVFLATIRADDAQIEASFSAAVKTAKKQKSLSLTRRAEASYVEYRRSKEQSTT